MAEPREVHLSQHHGEGDPGLDSAPPLLQSFVRAWVLAARAATAPRARAAVEEALSVAAGSAYPELAAHP